MVLKNKSSTRKVARIVPIFIGAALAVTQAHAAPAPVRYACTASDDLAVMRNHSTAHVDYAGHGYELQRKRSSIGDKYVSQNAALIIDGNSAIFVAEDLIDVGTCTRAIPVALTR